MARKPAPKDTTAFTPPPSPQRETRRAQVDLSFDNQSLLGALFGQFDANLVQVNEAGVPVNRWTTTGFLAASATTNETAWLTYKAVRSMGIVGFDNQARV